MILSRLPILAEPLNDFHRRSQQNWYKVVESFTGASETLMNKCVKEIKYFVNIELAGQAGPAKPYRGQLPPCPPLLLCECKL